MLKTLFELGFPLIWVIFWTLGGLWIVQTVFSLQRHEQALVGISLGLLLQAWVGSLFNLILHSPIADLLSAAVIFLVGLALIIQSHRSPLKTFPLTFDWPIFFLMVFFLFNLQRGLGI